jgi:hypothetical protein
MVEPLTHNPMFLGLNSAVTGTGSRKIANTIKISTYALVSEVFKLFFSKKIISLDLHKHLLSWQLS